jgi:ferric-dicitrate binding protein FerR (iron transport regulator)
MVVVSLTFIVAVLVNSAPAKALAVACGAAITLLLAVRIHKLQKMAQDLRTASSTRHCTVASA